MPASFRNSRHNSGPAPVQRSSWRIRRISPGQVRILQTLWSARLRRGGLRLAPRTSREARLRRIAEIVGREVETSKELTWREANQVIRRWLEESRAGGVAAANAPAMAGPASAAADALFPASEAAVSETPDAPSEAQLWKIRQIAEYLGWSVPGQPEKRLRAFLKRKFHVDSPEALPHDQAWRAIEALCAVGARERVRSRKGKNYSVKHTELTRAVAAFKRKLGTWRPAR